MTEAAPSFFLFSDVQPLVGAEFSLRGKGPDGVAIRLSSAQSLGFHRPPEKGGRESFTLLFHAPANLRVLQGTYSLSHPQLGTHELFLVPLGPDKDGMRLEVIFNFN